MSRSLYLLASILTCMFLSSCIYDGYNGEKKIQVDNINLHAEYYGYGKNHNGDEDILIKFYEQGNLETFISYNSLGFNISPYILRTSTTGEDGRSENIIKLTLTFYKTEIKNLLVNIETNSKNIGNSYISLYNDNTEIKKEQLKFEKLDIPVGAAVNKVIIYISNPKFYNGNQANNYFKFYYCLPYKKNGEKI